MPDPIMAPATSIAAPVRLMAFTNPDCGCADDSSFGAVTLDMQVPVGCGNFGGRSASALGREAAKR
jgi:hypothetical protein